MKKKLLVLSASAIGLFFMCGNSNVALKAEEEVSSIESSVVVEEPQQNEEVEFDFGDWLSETFDFKTIWSLLSDSAFIVAIVKLVSSLIKEKKLTAESKQELNKVIASLRNVMGDDLLRVVQDKLDDVMPKITETTKKTQDVLAKFAQVLALSQENTSESRVAILEILANMNLVSQDLITEAKNTVVEEKIAEDIKKEEVKQQLDEIIDDKGLN